MKICHSFLTMVVLAVSPGIAMSAEQDMGTMRGSESEVPGRIGDMQAAPGSDMPLREELGQPQGPEVFGKEPGRAVTAQNQSSNPKYLETTRSIRQKITERKDLSFSAKNVEIVTDDQGTVTLKGHVRGEDEKQTIEQIARGVASSGAVNNELVVDKR